MALSRNNLASQALRCETSYTRVHTVLPATKHKPYLPLLPSRRASLPFGQYSLRLSTNGWSGWVDLDGSLDWDKFPAPGVKPDTVTHPRVISVIWPTTPYRHREWNYIEIKWTRQLPFNKKSPKRTSVVELPLSLHHYICFYQGRKQKLFFVGLKPVRARYAEILGERSSGVLAGTWDKVPGQKVRGEAP